MIAMMPITDHPRIRGEHYQVVPQIREHFGSSPHTRGAPPASGCHTDRGGIIPAYAGSTSDVYNHTLFVSDHPRIRGEHPASTMSACRGAGSSPHTRGAPGYTPSQIPGDGIIPAYAGSTWSNQTRPVERPDHPRIRGEHSTRARLMAPTTGSSPHTRGAQASIWATPWS